MLDTVILHTDTDADYAARAAEVLRRGGLAAIPTETVYGLAANALDAEAVKRIYIAKGRPSDNPLIVHIADFDELAPLVQSVPEEAKKLADAFWPGPLTMILPKSDLVPAETSGGLSTVAVRMPAHPAAQAVIRAAGLPLAAPSANISGFPSPTRAEYVIDDLNGRVDLILDGGDCAVGVESTVITLAEEMPTILRPGGITPEQLRTVLGEVKIADAVLHPLKENETAASPGMKYKHYSPLAQIFIYTGSEKGYLRYLQTSQKEGLFALCFEEDAADCPVPCVTMGSKTDSLSQAQRLFDALRELDEAGAKTVLAKCPSKNGVGLAVCNRLFRAAAFRFVREGLILGLTGQTGAGKSTVAALLENQGFAIVDCDAIARKVRSENPQVIRQLCDIFGSDILEPDGSIAPKQLAHKAFSSAENTRKLNAVMHPPIIEETQKQALALSQKGQHCVIDAPLLFQCSLDKICDWTIAVTAPEEIRIARIMQRDGIDRAAARERLSRQEPESYYTQKADFVIPNAPPCDAAKETRHVLERMEAHNAGE